MESEQEKFEYEEKIRQSLLRNRGEIVLTAKDLKLPYNAVKSIAKKMEKAARKHSMLFSEQMMPYLISGYKQRMAYLTRYLDKLENKEEAIVSICCEVPVESKFNDSGELKTFCLKCEKQCPCKVITAFRAYELRAKFLEMLKEEDVLLVDYADRLGFLPEKKSDAPPAPQPIQQQNLVVMGNLSKYLDPVVVQQILAMTPMERERLRKQIGNRIVEPVNDQESAQQG